MRINARGEITIPAGLLEKAGLKPETDVEMSLDGAGVRIAAAKPAGSVKGSETPGQRAVRLLKAGPKPHFTTDEIMAMTRGDDWRSGR
jgi:bifunctional DNA-binding transcriptional regulator/antitoxin component of YhaV-PrlF toxin-antitoxin module